MKKRKRAEGERGWRRGMPELAAMLVTGMSILGVATMGGSSAPARSGAARTEKPPAVANATGGAVAIHYIDADRDVLDLQLD